MHHAPVQSIPNSIQRAIRRAQAVPALANGDWSVCIRDAGGGVLVQFRLAAQHQVGRLVVELMACGWDLDEDDPGRWDLVFKPAELLVV